MDGIIINNKVYKLSEFKGDSYNCDACPLHKRCWEDKVSDECLLNLVFDANPNACLEKTETKVEID